MHVELYCIPVLFVGDPVCEVSFNAMEFGVFDHYFFQRESIDVCPLAMIANLHRPPSDLLLDRYKRPLGDDYLPEVFEFLSNHQ